MLSLILGASPESGGLEWKRPIPCISRRDSGVREGSRRDHSCTVKLEGPALYRTHVALAALRPGLRLGLGLGCALATSRALGWHST